MITPVREHGGWNPAQCHHERRRGQTHSRGHSGAGLYCAMRSGCAPSPKAGISRRTSARLVQDDRWAVRQTVDQSGIGREPSLPGTRRLAHPGRARHREARQIRVELGLPPQGIAFGRAGSHGAWRPCAAWKSSVLRPTDSRCRRKSWSARAWRRPQPAARSLKPRIVPRPSPAPVCCTRRSGEPPCITATPKRTRRLRADLSDWCVREPWFKARCPDAKLMHCLPVRRNVAVADEVLGRSSGGGQAQAFNRLTVQMAVLHRMLA